MYQEAPLIFKNFKFSLMYTNNDSFILHLYSKTKGDVYGTMIKFQQKFNFSNYPKTHPCYCEKNPRKLNVMKDKYAGNIIIEVVALRPKMYSIKIFEKDQNGGNDFRKCKGIQEAVVRNEITHKSYHNCLFNNLKFRHSQVTIRAFKHHVFTIQEKTSLTNTDDKRFILKDGVHTLPYGYKT